MSWQWNGKAYSVPVTGKDVLTLARAVNEEGYPAPGVAWTLLQRVAWLNSHGTPISIGKLAEQYAQPINPKWFPGGEFHEKEMDRLSRLGDSAGIAREESNAKSRPVKASKPWIQLKSTTRNVIDSILNNRSRSPHPSAVHYWATRGPEFSSNQNAKPNLKLLDSGYGFSKTNVFFANDDSHKLGRLSFSGGSGPGEFLVDGVSVGIGQDSPGARALGILAGLTMLGGGAWYAYKRYLS
jgi:hypothetical protein